MNTGRKVSNAPSFSWTARNEQQSWDFIVGEDGDKFPISDGRYDPSRNTEVAANEPVRRGILRHILLILDFGESSSETDMPPSRARCMASVAAQFIVECSRQNPLCQIGLLVMRDGLVERRQGLTTMLNTESASAKSIPEWLKDVETRGETSLQNALSVAHGLLLHVPAHGTREVILIQSSLASCDPSDIFTTLELLRRDRIRVSIISLSAQVRIAERIAKETGGTYSVAMDSDHFKSLLFDEHIRPPAVFANAVTSAGVALAAPTSYLVPMGFPKSLGSHNLSLCSCHARPPEAHSGGTFGGFQCPQCKGKVCQIPVDCPQCGLTLISAPHLARTYHHLFPIDVFREAKIELSFKCMGCLGQFSKAEDPVAYVCPKCTSSFCQECNIFIHEALHSCPQCI